MQISVTISITILAAFSGTWFADFSQAFLYSGTPLFSERELTFTFAICYCPSVVRRL